MHRFINAKIALFIVSFFIVGCASTKLQYDKKNAAVKFENIEYNGTPEHSFYLIGDAGNAEAGKNLTHFKLLKQELATAKSNTTVLFLGNNIYEKGMPDASDPERALAEHRLNAQIDLVNGFKGQSIFIPGNHDYYNNGVIGLEREANYIVEKLNNKNAFFPHNGCPIEEVPISENLVLIVIDSQWYLENWDKNPTMNNDCSIKTREKFFYEYERILKQNTLKSVVVAIHHPMFSYGFHAGQYSWKDQIYPTGGSFPLPVIGSIINVFRKTSGFTPQDMQNPYYQELKKRILTISQKFDQVLFVSGHEHNLQYIVKDKIPQIISGAGSKTAASRVMSGSEFSYGNYGYAKLVKYTNGASWVYFYTENNGKKELLFKTDIQEKTQPIDTSNFKNNYGKEIAASVYPKKAVEKNKAYQFFWGKHYRKYYGIDVEAPVVNLDTLFGGLTPYRVGGDNLSKSLRLTNANGNEFVMRALHRSPTEYLQTVTFKDQYIKGEYNNTYIEKFLLDLYTSAHPYAPLTIGKLSDAANIYNSNPTLYYVPNQIGLQEFNTDFGNQLYFIEALSTSENGTIKSYGNSNTIVNSDTFFKNIKSSDTYRVDEDFYIRTRLFDMLIGDWKRQEEDWAWAEFKEGEHITYRPIAKKRDQAYSRYDGFILGIFTRINQKLKQLQVYNDDIRSVKWLNTEAYPIDMAIINQATFENWQAQVTYLQNNITNEVIEAAFNEMPAEMKDETLVEIKASLKVRLQNLSKTAEKYYKILSKYPVVKGNDEENWFEVDRSKSGQTKITIYAIENGKKGKQLFHKVYNAKKTKEIWIYGLADNDIFNATGSKGKVIPIRMIGGQGNDTYNFENDHKIIVYDFKAEENHFESKPIRKKLSNNYKENLYSFTKLKSIRYQIVPVIGSTPDNGLKIGAGSRITVNGFERNPFTQQHTIQAGYFISNSAFDIIYNAEFANIFDRWNFVLNTLITSPNYTYNFFGYGNDSQNYSDQLGDSYYKVGLQNIKFDPALKWIGRMGGNVKLGFTAESFEVEKSVSNIVSDNPNLFPGERNNYLGMEAAYFFKNTNDNVFPTLGMEAALQVGWKTNINIDSNQNNGYIVPLIGFTYNITSNSKVVVATKLKGTIIIGDTFQFYNAASIGGLDGLRGYNNNRFTGNASFYQNTDLRLNLTQFKTKIVPFQLGIFGGFDYGRVWYDNENNKGLKTSYGGGIWADTARLMNFNLSVFDSKDGVFVRFGLGFGF
jgi:hypothetical protein